MPEGDCEKAATPSTSSPVPIPELPVPLFVWRIFLVVAVCLYSSFTIFVHLCEADGKLPFRTTSVVFVVEFVKLIFSGIMFARPLICGPQIYQGFFQAIRNELRRSYHNTTDKFTKSPNSTGPPPLNWSQLMIVVVPFMVPAILYAINNNLALLIQLEMDPATYQVLGNFKVLSTAILFRLIIKRVISPLQWFALLLLLCAGFTHSYGSLLAKVAPAVTSDVAQAGAHETSFHLIHITTLGILMISFYCTISGLSGVYTEFVMKKRAQMSIHIQNGLLYFFGIFLNWFLFILDVYRSGDHEYWNLFKGYNHWTWLIVITQSMAGIFMGFVMKYSNNITRLFIISSAMLVTTFTAMVVFGLQLNILFVISFLLVCTSLYLYHL